MLLEATTRSATPLCEAIPFLSPHRPLHSCEIAPFRALPQDFPSRACITPFDGMYYNLWFSCLNPRAKVTSDVTWNVI
jgi:hypothetical protein